MRHDLIRHHLIAIALVVAAGACTSSHPAATTVKPITARAVPAAVDVQLDLVDTSRAAVDPIGERNAPTRALPTMLRIPASAKPVPLIVFAHGYDGDPTKFTELFQHWVDAGFAVLAPRFPVTYTGAARGPLSRSGDVTEQPADLTFALDALLHSRWKGRIDRDRIGAAGLSLGGATIWSYVANTCCRDPRIKAAIIMDGIRLDHPKGKAIENPMPLLVYHADRDYALPFASARTAYDSAKPPKYFVTIFGALHAEPYENTPAAADAMVETTSTRFWRAYLLGDDAARHEIVTAATIPGISTAESESG
ncbi:MAG: dienelactone hydrolase family protein [Acidimicrobiia bacterium]|nr:dienelactone hydrolase family protein [Acidimicrobiia bacterium]